MMLSDVCLSLCLSVAYIVNIHGAHSYWKQGALGAIGVRRVWAGAGPHRVQGGDSAASRMYSLLLCPAPNRQGH